MSSHTADATIGFVHEKMQYARVVGRVAECLERDELAVARHRDLARRAAIRSRRRRAAVSSSSSSVRHARASPSRRTRAARAGRRDPSARRGSRSRPMLRARRAGRAGRRAVPVHVNARQEIAVRAAAGRVRSPARDGLRAPRGGAAPPGLASSARPPLAPPGRPSTDAGSPSYIAWNTTVSAGPAAASARSEPGLSPSSSTVPNTSAEHQSNDGSPPPIVITPSPSSRATAMPLGPLAATTIGVGDRPLPARSRRRAASARARRRPRPASPRNSARTCSM